MHQITKVSYGASVISLFFFTLVLLFFHFVYSLSFLFFYRYTGCGQPQRGDLFAFFCNKCSNFYLYNLDFIPSVVILHPHGTSLDKMR